MTTPPASAAAWIRSGSSNVGERLIVSRARITTPLTLLLAALSLALTSGCSGCNKKKEETPIPAPPPPGAASRDELSTSLGQARGIDEGLAPTSVKWNRVIVLDSKRAVLTGSAVTETIALYTDDAGKTWKSFRSERDAWASWSASLDGSIVLATGARDGAPTPQTAKTEATKVAFGAFDAAALTAPVPLFPTAKGPVGGVVQVANAIPVALGPESTALVVEETPRKLTLVYGGKPGAEAVPPLKLPAGEKVIPVPYARPPLMLSLKGRDLWQRPFPAAGKPLDKPQKVANLPSSPALFAELSAPPLCETGAWSFQRVSGPNKRIAVVGVSPGKVLSFPLPDSTLPTTLIGCGANRVVVEAVQAKTGPPVTHKDQPDVPVALTCTFAGKCTSPKNAPFRVWPGEHKREIAMAATEKGTLAVMAARAGQRWGLYLGQSPDGITWERQRVIGEGPTDRGLIELGALISFGKRAVLLISADVTGTSRRGWFVLVSDDGGTSWNPP